MKMPKNVDLSKSINREKVNEPLIANNEKNIECPPLRISPLKKEAPIHHVGNPQPHYYMGCLRFASFPGFENIWCFMSRVSPDSECFLCFINVPRDVSTFQSSSVF